MDDTRNPNNFTGITEKPGSPEPSTQGKTHYMFLQYTENDTPLYVSRFETVWPVLMFLQM
jgi:hypothetical protein